jgi:alpha-L-rhamnosidase
MNSHNHAMFAGVGAAFFTRLAGITALRPGFDEIGIRPVMPKRLAFVKAAVETVKGQVAVHWRRGADGLVVEVTVPVNATARIALPAPDAKAVTPRGPRFVGMEHDRAVYLAGSGTYEFRIR